MFFIFYIFNYKKKLKIHIFYFIRHINLKWIMKNFNKKSALFFISCKFQYSRNRDFRLLFGTNKYESCRLIWFTVSVKSLGTPWKEHKIWVFSKYFYLKALQKIKKNCLTVNNQCAFFWCDLALSQSAFCIRSQWCLTTMQQYSASNLPLIWA